MSPLRGFKTLRFNPVNQYTSDLWAKEDWVHGGFAERDKTHFWHKGLACQAIRRL